MNDSILVAEIFGPTLQGEGAMTGAQTVFVRTGGCDFRCSWCDSGHAVDPPHKSEWQRLTAREIMQTIMPKTFGMPILITLSGGNPALQPLESLIDMAHDEYNCPVAMETQGTISKPWFYKLDHLILSPKPPSSHMPFSKDKLQACLNAALSGKGWINPVSHRVWPQLSVKVVVMNEDDYYFAQMIHREFAHPFGIPFFITPGNHTPPSLFVRGKEVANEKEFDFEGIVRRTEWLLQRCTEDSWHEARIIPQLHTFLWSNERGR
jgi:7-carboxy-7-deazaguanine synthase